MLVKTHEVDERRDLLADLVLRRSREFERKRDVVVDRARGKQVEVLEDHADGAADLAQIVVGKLREILAVDDDAAARRAVEQVDAAYKRALACARATDDAEDFSGADVYGDILERIKRRSVRTDVSLRNVFELDHGMRSKEDCGGSALVFE